ncbi:type 2 glycerol-3-phosphate oxidase [Spiroplasma endosymbiont of Cantharis rufa]|uniref:type 2 glycerol-3-phosphate oxidase n=1 Tax=Spiroplasma endosymbiont of Cantharis rufa TaxID=3066279 RepID=UPI0030CF98B6
MTKNNYDICIIGAGIIGASIARELSKFKQRVIILEANPSFGLETTTGNSGLIHGGFDPTPGKLNAKLNLLGRKRYKENWFKELDFNHKSVNSLVLAFNKEEEKHLDILMERGFKNGCTNDEITLIDKKEIQLLEPFISKEVTKALLCTSSFIINPVELTGVLLKNAKKNGVEIKFNQKVVAIKYNNNLFDISSENTNYKAKIIINCAGHFADKISSLSGYSDFQLSTKRGEYIVLKKTKENQVNNVLFMVPTIHGKGVIVAKTLEGNLLVGPTSEDNVSKEDINLITEEKFNQIKEIGKKIMPSLDVSKIISRFAGSRPIYKETDDFYIKYAKLNNKFINVAGTKSPGISCAPSIADYVINMVKEQMNLELKLNWDKYEKNILF